MNRLRKMVMDLDNRTGKQLPVGDLIKEAHRLIALEDRFKDEIEWTHGESFYVKSIRAEWPLGVYARAAV